MSRHHGENSGAGENSENSGTGSHCAHGLIRKWQSRTLGGTLAPSRNTSTHGRASDALPIVFILLSLHVFLEHATRIIASVARLTRTTFSVSARTPLRILSLAILYVFRPGPAIRGVQRVRVAVVSHPGGNPGANPKSISHRCHPILWHVYGS